MVDVPGRGFLGNKSRADRGDELDVDAIIVPLRHLSSALPRLALEANIGADYFGE